MGTLRFVEADTDIVVGDVDVGVGLTEIGVGLAEGGEGLAGGGEGLTKGGAVLVEGGAGLAEGEEVVVEGGTGLLPASFIGGTVMVEVTTAGPAVDGRVLTMTVPVDFGGAIRKKVFVNFGHS